MMLLLMMMITLAKAETKTRGDDDIQLHHFCFWI